MKRVPGVARHHAVSRNFRPSQAARWPEKPKRDQVRPPTDGGLWNEEEFYASIRTRAMESILNKFFFSDF